MTGKRTWCLAVLWAGWAASGLAQDGRSVATQPEQAPGRARSFEVTVAALWLTPSALGSSAATLTSNPGGAPYTLFEASGELRTTSGLEARVGYHVTRTIAVEGGVTYSRPAVGFTIASDAEGAAGFTATGELLSQLVVDARLLGYLPALAFADGRARPFLEAGAGYLLQLHGQSSVISPYYATDRGQVYHAGGGLVYFFRTRREGTLKALGLRVDGRLYLTRGGFTFGAVTPRQGALGAGLLLAF